MTTSSKINKIGTLIRKNSIEENHTQEDSMNTIKRKTIMRYEVEVAPSEEKYTTLEKIDLTDIAQAIDGSKSMSEDESYRDASEEKDNKPKFWFW